ncbi:cyclic nucleotide-binding domain-containing protein 2-like [Nematostella vectensis]|uniref:cyclic nucleotide-binding domain-containing protein 2-like n=1 Tax=Nematostella vectensis TaxID=45351 RepID=UPI002076FCB8|nr:cyclic nucleotide-binding domain-containing protein 2-like [Nematostella vectensis]
MWHTSVILHRGDSFGELTLLRKTKHTASVAVREDVEMLVVNKDVFAITCPKIYDKEIGDKITFCKNLKLFEPWSEDLLKNICFEAQVQEWKLNRIIVKDSSKETEWIYMCMQGKCSVVKIQT